MLLSQTISLNRKFYTGRTAPGLRSRGAAAARRAGTPQLPGRRGIDEDRGEANDGGGAKQRLARGGVRGEGRGVST